MLSQNPEKRPSIEKVIDIVNQIHPLELPKRAKVLQTRIYIEADS